MLILVVQVGRLQGKVLCVCVCVRERERAMQKDF